jgi:RNA polymerase sigma-70 factor (ECF subfamily)
MSRPLFPPIVLGETRDLGPAMGVVARDRQSRFDEFVAEHRDRAVGLAWRLVGGDAAAAEDVTQEALIRAYRGLERFREDSSLRTWFYKILVNEARRHRRWQWVRSRFAGEMPEEVADARGEAVADPMLRRRVLEAIDRLPRGQRESFVLVYLEGLTVQQAADVAGRAIGTTKSHLHRALARLRDELADVDTRPVGTAT